MAGSLGSLVVSLEANIASFTRDMGRASATTTQAMDQINGALDTVKDGLAALGVTASVAGFIMVVKGAVDAADNLRDMAQQTGVAVETLNGLGFAAGQAGGSLESMVAAAGKLNKTIAEAAGGNAEAKEAFKALGISTTDASGKLKAADVIMAEVADQFEKFRDGPEKSAMALRLFGKAGADMIPLLNDGGSAMRDNIEYAKRYSGATSELSNMADTFNDTLGKLAIQQRGFVNDLAAQLLPTMQRVADAFLGAAESGEKLHTWSGRVSESVKLLTGIGVTAAFVFEDYGIKIGAAAAKLEAYARLDFAGVRLIDESSLGDLAKARSEYEKLRNDIRTGASGKDGFGKLFDKLEGQIASERELLMTRNQMVAKTQNDGLMTIKDANVAKVGAQAEYVKNIKALYDQEIAVMMAAKRFAKTPDAAASIQAQIDGIYKKQALAGSDISKPAAPILSSGTKGKTDAQKAIEEGNRLVAKLKEQDEAYGLSGAALLQYQLAQSKLPKSIRDEAMAHQINIDAKSDSAEGSKNIADASRRAQEESDRAQKEVERAIKQNAMNVGQIEIGLMTEVQQAENAHQLRLQELQTFHDTKLENVVQANALIEAENARHERTKADMQAQYNLQSIGMAGSAADQLYSLMQKSGMEQSALGRAMFLVSKALAVAEIIINTEVAASKAGAQLGIFGIPMATMIRVTGYASAGMVAGTAIASAKNGYDIPAGVDPMIQAHEKEMVLPRAQADVIRGLAANGGRGGAGGVSVTYAPNIQIDGSTDMARNRQMIASAVQQGNVDLVDKLQRARLI
jgi:hypothetical protein